MAEVGRPTVMTKETIDKLEYVFAMGGTDKEACLYAGISHQTLYDYQKDHPEFVERKEQLKETPVLRARETVIQNLSNPQTAEWYLERKKKDEFSPRVETAHSGSIKHELAEEEKKAVDEILSENAVDNERTPQSQTDTLGGDASPAEIPV